MRAAVLILTLCGLLSGCESANPSDSYDRELKNYLACVIIHADRFAERSGEDPYYLALAARDACQRERLIAQRAVYAAEHPQTGARIWQIYEDSVIEDTTARITRRRVN